MILIGGTGLTADELPYGAMMEYTVESNDAILKIKLKTVAKQSSCLVVYLHSDMVDFELFDDVREKVKFFNSDEHLIKLLDSGGAEIEVQDTLEEALITQAQEEAEVVPEFATPLAGTEVDIAVEIPLSPSPKVMELVLEDVDTDLSETFFSIPNVTDNMDSLAHQLEVKQRIIDQKDGQLMELRRGTDDLYKLQEIQLLEMRATYEQRVESADEAMELLRKQVAESNVPSELQWFMKYASYSQNYKASLKEGFTEEELASMGKLTSDVYIFASGSGDSFYSMMKNVKSLMDTNDKPIIVDFSGGYFMNFSYKLQSREHSLLLADDSVEVLSLAKDCGLVKFIPTTLFNDITLLGLDWAKVLKKLNLYSGGRPLILLFNSINSFSVRYTVSKLATIGKLFVFTKCNPIILNCDYYDLNFIPESRFTLVAMEHFPAVDKTLEKMAQKYSIQAFKDEVNWSKLKIRV
jgi:hypothetical protein